MTRACESCGARADVRLKDGSTWCRECDGSARHMGYDHAPIAYVYAHARRNRLGLASLTAAQAEVVNRALATAKPIKVRRRSTDA